MFKNRAEGLLPISTYFGYGVGQIGGQILRDTPALILPIYMTLVLGLDAALSGLVIIIAKFWVVAADPIAGIISDRTNTRWGRRRPFILGGGLLAAVCFVLLFVVPEIRSQTVLFFYMTVVYVLLNTGYSLFAVPYLTMATEMSRQPQRAYDHPVVPQRVPGRRPDHRGRARTEDRGIRHRGSRRHAPRGLRMDGLVPRRGNRRFDDLGVRGHRASGRRAPSARRRRRCSSRFASPGATSRSSS